MRQLLRAVPVTLVVMGFSAPPAAAVQSAMTSTSGEQIAVFLDGTLQRAIADSAHISIGMGSIGVLVRRDKSVWTAQISIATTEDTMTEANAPMALCHTTRPGEFAFDPLWKAGSRPTAMAPEPR